MLKITAYTTTSALGHGNQAALQALLDGRSGLLPNTMTEQPLPTWIGCVPEVQNTALPEDLRDFDCRNHRLAMLALRQDSYMDAVDRARARYGPRRIGVFLGTSTSGIEHTETAYRERIDHGPLPAWFSYDHSQSMHALGEFVSLALDLNGPFQVVSTACSSSAKVFGVAWRHITAGICDAAVVGGSDSLCRTTLYGFNSLQLVSSRPCRPWGADRDGISIGEAAGFALLERTDTVDADANDTHLYLLGYGESSDAWHMSSPHPEGKGARLAMQDALHQAQLEPAGVDYINLHGTGTPANDAAEDVAITTLFGRSVPCSSTKGYTGHTLGAAGITEAVFSLLAVKHGFMPGTSGTGPLDPGLKSPVLLETRRRRIDRVLSNSFGFGGNNCSLLLGRPS